MIEVSRYVVFGFDAYYPAGGWFDYVGWRDTVEEAAQLCRDKVTGTGELTWMHQTDFAHVVDLGTNKVVWKDDQRWAEGKPVPDPAEEFRHGA